MKQIIFTINPDEFSDNLSTKIVEKLIDALKSVQTKKSEEYLTRHETIAILKISLVTLWSWQKKGKLPAYSIANRVYFKRSDIEKALTQINK